MAHARPEYAIIVAVLGILTAIGVPAFKRGQFIVGGVCAVLAAAVLAWVIVALRRQRG